MNMRALNGYVVLLSGSLISLITCSASDVHMCTTSRSKSSTSCRRHLLDVITLQEGSASRTQLSTFWCYLFFSLLIIIDRSHFASYVHLILFLRYVLLMFIYAIQSASKTSTACRWRLHDVIALQEVLQWPAYANHDTNTDQYIAQ